MGPACYLFKNFGGNFMGNYVILRTGTKGIKNECLLVCCCQGFFIEKLICLNIVTREMSRLLMLSEQQVISYRQKNDILVS